MIIETSEAGITCRSTGPQDEIIERPYDYVIATKSLQNKNKITEVVMMLNQNRAKR